MDRDNRKFVAYRPKRHSGRLEGVYHTPGSDTWKPSIGYQHPVNTIRKQYTPAEAYRFKLASQGKNIRGLQRLEWRWEKAKPLWIKCATAVQAGYRGMVGRRYYNSLYEKLVVLKQQRELIAKIHKQFNNNDKDAALITIEEVAEKTTEFHVAKIKILYTQQKYDLCELAARHLISIDEYNEDAHYILASCLVQRGVLNEAYDALKIMMSTIDSPHADCYRLIGCVCMTMKPPRVREAVDAFDCLVQLHPEDMNALFQQACGNASLQDFDKALKALNTIQHYTPNQPEILAIRARVFACKRMWSASAIDYNTILRWPERCDQTVVDTAFYGLQQVDPPYEPVPMLDLTLVDDKE